MPQPVIAYHLILTAYGFWLPNDPRGSGSETVRAGQLTPFGPATRCWHKQAQSMDRTTIAKSLSVVV